MERTAQGFRGTSARIGFGCAGLMREPSLRARQHLLGEAFEQDLTHFDVARMYGLGVAERELGRFANGRRDKIQIATKFGIATSTTTGRLARLQGPARRLLNSYPALRRYVKQRSRSLEQPRRYDPATAKSSLETSLKELGTDYVDLLLLHDPAPDDSMDLPAVAAYLEGARQAGYVRKWGVAGEKDPCIALKRSLPDHTVLQLHDDPLLRESPLPDDLQSLITFGVVGTSLLKLSSYLQASSERRDRWSQTLGVDCGATYVLVSLLLSDALAANPNGLVLYSTSKPQHLRRLSTDLSANTNPQILTTFRTLLRDELQHSADASPAK